jgi:hypothetical protein
MEIQNIDFTEAVFRKENCVVYFAFPTNGSIGKLPVGRWTSRERL